MRNCYFCLESFLTEEDRHIHIARMHPEKLHTPEAWSQALGEAIQRAGLRIERLNLAASLTGISIRNKVPPGEVLDCFQWFLKALEEEDKGDLNAQETFLQG